MRDPTDLGSPELRPAVVALILVLAVELCLEERSVHHARRDAGGPRERSPKRMEIGAVPGLGREAVL